jgi:hypothetical protein
MPLHGKENWFVMVNAPENVGQNWNELTKQAREIDCSKKLKKCWE